jgi:hypothetical protein
MKKILVVGPSNDINNFSKNDFINYKTKGYTIFSYSDSLDFFIKNNITPDYFSFLDPYTLTHYLDTFNKGFCKNTTLLTADIYKNALKGFFNLKYTCNRLKNNTILYNNVLNLDFNQIFKKHIIKKYIKTNYNNFINCNFKTEYSLLINPGYNFCKFSYILLPLLLNHFQNLEEIKIIGFGHYSVGRYYYSNTNNKGYEEFKDSYNQIKIPLKKTLIKNNIKISFDGKESYFKELTTL